VRKRWTLAGSTTSLGFAPALVMLVLAGYVLDLFWWTGLMFWRLPGPIGLTNLLGNAWLVGTVVVCYVAWVLALARQWVTGATGAGFAVAASGLFLRIVVELPSSIAQVSLAEMQPPQPYATVLPLGRDLGLIAVVFGLACVLAACVAERRLRRSGPPWAHPS
jgi:hypothetical protein